MSSVVSTEGCRRAFQALFTEVLMSLVPQLSNLANMHLFLICLPKALDSQPCRAHSVTTIDELTQIVG